MGVGVGRVCGVSTLVLGATRELWAGQVALWPEALLSTSVVERGQERGGEGARAAVERKERVGGRLAERRAEEGRTS